MTTTEREPPDSQPRHPPGPTSRARLPALDSDRSAAHGFRTTMDVLEAVSVKVTEPVFFGISESVQVLLVGVEHVASRTEQTPNDEERDRRSEKENRLATARRRAKTERKNWLEQQCVVALLIGIRKVSLVPPVLVLEGQLGQIVVGVGQFFSNLICGFSFMRCRGREGANGTQKEYACHDKLAAGSAPCLGNQGNSAPPMFRKNRIHSQHDILSFR